MDKNVSETDYIFLFTNLYGNIGPSWQPFAKVGFSLTYHRWVFLLFRGKITVLKLYHDKKNRCARGEEGREFKGVEGA
jgi:hypothetical protein